MVRADGGIFLCHIFGRAIDPKDLSKGTVWMLEDVTERRQAEDDIRHAREVAGATKAKSDFLASHEIRTPMNAIIGMSHLALKTNLDKKQRNYIEKVHRARVKTCWASSTTSWTSPKSKPAR